ncbi:hypothetical protein, partial [Salmonella enterica]|uniref:hypothetical protein n=1 Tax=Salmonella enterica TaxID=28901 RepID=UPI00135DBE86
IHPHLSSLKTETVEDLQFMVKCLITNMEYSKENAHQWGICVTCLAIETMHVRHLYPSRTGELVLMWMNIINLIPLSAPREYLAYLMYAFYMGDFEAQA